MKYHFFANKSPKSLIALSEYERNYKNYSIEDSDICIVLGGDGTLLYFMHLLYQKSINKKKVLGINCGSRGVVLHKKIDVIENILDKSVCYTINPLTAKYTDNNKKSGSLIAFNDISLFRQEGQAISIKLVCGKVNKQIYGDGIIVSTPLGSSGYYRSLGGPRISHSTKALGIMPINTCIERDWKGIIISQRESIICNSQDTKRKSSCFYDYQMLRDTLSIEVKVKKSFACQMIFPEDTT